MPGDHRVATQQTRAVQRFGRVVTGPDHAVVGVDEDDNRLSRAGLFLVHLPVGDEDDEVAWVHQPGRGAIDADDARAARAWNDVGLEAGAVRDVDDGHFLARVEVCGVEQVLVDRDRTDVVQVGLRHRRPVDLAREHGAEHQQSCSRGRADRSMLSIRRVVPTLAATTIRLPSGAGSKDAGSTRSR